MKVDVVLELMDGRSLEAVFARPFIPEENEFRIMLAKGGDVGDPGGVFS